MLPCNLRLDQNVVLFCTLRNFHGTRKPQQRQLSRFIIRRPTNTSLTNSPGRGATRKRRPKSPSSILIKALQGANKHVALPYKPSTSKVDYSYMSPRVHDTARWQLELLRSKNVPMQPLTEVRQSLQTVLAKYVGIINDNVNNVQSEEWIAGSDHELLAERGYTLEDVKDWYSILTASNTDDGARMFLDHIKSSTGTFQQTKKPLPNFVLLFFLRRETISPGALRAIFIFVWQELYRMESRLTATEKARVQNSHSEFGVLDPSSLYLMIVRLLRHARNVWPDALISIAAIATGHLGLYTSLERSASPIPTHHETLKRLSGWYNKILSLLAVPARLSPLHSVDLHQRAQFDVLQRMAEHEPPLSINREGYRAIVAIQLANKKTDQEREWAHLKAKSWPPWKEDKLGIDAEKGPEDGVSRALQAIRRAREAGYGDRLWERVARILAGWDIDGSPTIQTRGILSHKLLSRRDLNPESPTTKHLTASSDPYNSHHIWAARIRATRTVQEAWACFLAYGDRHLRPNQEVYFAMLRKLVSRPPSSSWPGQEKRPAKGSALQYDERPLDPGDSLEVQPTPESPKETTYVRTPPPTFDQLVNEMFANNVVPSPQYMVFLIANAKCLSHGLKYIKFGSRNIPSMESLLTQFPELDHRVHEIPLPIFAAYIRLLTRSTSITSKDSFTSSVNKEDLPRLQDTSVHDENPVVFAARLLRVRNPPRLPPWNYLLDSLSLQNALIDDTRPGPSNSAQHLEKYLLMQRVWQDILNLGLTPGFDTFKCMCKGLENAISATLYANQTDYMTPLERLSDNSSQDSKAYSTHGWSLRAFARLDRHGNELRLAFAKLWGKERLSTDMNSSSLQKTQMKLPTLLAMPQAPAMHAYMRVLGLQRNWDAMLELLSWMAEHQREISDAVDMPRNGKKLLRRTVVATRVYLERSWSSLPDFDERFRSAAAPEWVIERARQLIVGVETWKGWPLDAEVDEYCRNGRFPGLYTQRSTGIENE